jgi:hypothetical protein
MGPIDPTKLMMLQGIPQVQIPTIPQPQIMAPSQQAQGAPMNTGAAILDGVAKFVQGVRQETEHQKQQAASQVDRDLKLLAMGVPVDQKAILKNMKQAGINISKESITAPVPDPSRPGFEMQQPGGYMGQSPQPQQMPQAQMPGPAPQQPQPGIWARMGQALGLPQGGDNAGGEQWLQQFAQRAQQRQQLGDRQMALQGQQMDFEEGKLAALKGLTSSDQATSMKAAQYLDMIGVVKMHGVDELVALAAKASPGKDLTEIRKEVTGLYMANALGMNQVRSQMMTMAEKLTDRFQGDASKAMQYVQEIWEHGTSKLQPGRTVQENISISEQANKINTMYPTAGGAVGQVMALAQATGDNETIGKLYKMLNEVDTKGNPKFPSKGQLDLMVEQAKLNQGAQRIQVDRDQMAQQMKIHADNFRLNTLGIISNSVGRQFDDARAIYMDKNADTKQKNAALERMAELTHTLGTLKIPVGKDANGKEVTINLSAGGMTTEDVEGLLNPIRRTFGWPIQQRLVNETATIKNDSKPETKESDMWSEFNKAFINTTDYLSMKTWYDWLGPQVGEAGKRAKSAAQMSVTAEPN